jgi:EAL domain-containing protein (putative c-di-GMP-specific phosphodiesterase class I)
MVSHELAQALDRDELTVSFQPKLDLESGDCRHAEALVRWSHPTLGTVSPAEFVPLAEHSGLMDQLTRQVLGKTVRQLAAWNRDGLRIKVSINVSAVDLLGGDLAGDLDRILHSHGVDAAQICLEITETAVMGHDAATQPVLEALDAIGVELAIDDFGTGYSSLAQLKRLPVAELTIDRAFLSGVPEDAEDTIIVRSVIELAHNMNLRVVAEGVETAACCRWLAATGCEMAQGYAIGRPMPAAEFATWVREFDPTRLFPTGETDSDVQISNSAIV